MVLPGVAGLTLLALSACASGPRISELLKPGEPCRIEYYQAKENRPLRVQMINRSHEPMPVRPGQLIGPSTVSDAEMNRLVTEFEDRGFFADASSARIPGSYLAVHLKSGSHYLSTSDAQWPQCFKMFMDLYNLNPYTTGAGTTEGKAFDPLEEKRRIERINAEQRINAERRSKGK